MSIKNKLSNISNTNYTRNSVNESQAKVININKDKNTITILYSNNFGIKSKSEVNMNTSSYYPCINEIIRISEYNGVIKVYKLNTDVEYKIKTSNSPSSRGGNLI